MFGVTPVLIGCPQGGKMGICHSLEIGTKNEKFLENLKSGDSLASGCFRRFSEKKRLNARGFAREYLRSYMLYRPGKSLKRRGKSSNLHSKKKF